MKDIEQIQELLNCYLDDELDERKINEVKRLIDHDDSIRELYESLKKSKILISSIPAASAPGELLDGVRTSLERQMLLEGPSEGSYKAGRAHLVIRRIMTIAAVLVLITALSFIVFDIFVPPSSRKQMMASFSSKKSKKQILFEKPFADIKPVVDRKIVQESSLSVPLIAKLVFNTSAPIMADTIIGKSIMNQNLFACTSSIDRGGDSITYVLDCDKSQIVALMGEMEILWAKCRQVSLSLGTKDFGSYVDIGNLSAADAIEIVNIDDYGRRMRMASDIARINSVSVPDVIGELYADLDVNHDFEVPKPTLTSVAEPNNSTARASSGNSTLTIVIINR